MFFSGIQKTSCIDYPNKIATVFFTGGCNFKCPYCHNGHLVNNSVKTVISEVEALDIVNQRKGFIDAVVISGGEPTLFSSKLICFMEKVKDIGYLVKLDTNGTNPELILEVISKELIDYIAMDIKAPIDKYEDITKTKVNTDSILKSIEIIKSSGIDYEFRTTVCNELLSEDDIKQIINKIAPCNKYYLQNFVDGDSVLAGKGKFTPVNYLDSIARDYEHVYIR